MFMILFFIPGTDLVEITLHKKRYCFTDSNPRRLSGKIYLPLLIATLLPLKFILDFKNLAHKSKIYKELSIDPIIKSRPTLVFSL